MKTMNELYIKFMNSLGYTEDCTHRRRKKEKEECLSNEELKRIFCSEYAEVTRQTQMYYW